MISLRTRLDSVASKTICFHHEQKIFCKFSNWQNKFCDPFSKHKNAVKAGLQEITLEAWAACQGSYISLSDIQGQKMCPTCHTELSRLVKDFHDELEEIRMAGACKSDAESEYDLNSEVTRESLDSSFADLDMSAMKLHDVASHSKVCYGKRKFKQIQ